MKRLIVESWLLLLHCEWIIRFRDFEKLHRAVRREPVRPTETSRCVPVERLCRAMDYACVFYFKRLWCLQRSSATAMILRRYGHDAQLVIGAQMVPFKSHAWCEINGAVVNDIPYIRDIYEVLERC
jgi:hypothetical protein